MAVCAMDQLEPWIVCNYRNGLLTYAILSMGSSLMLVLQRYSQSRRLLSNRLFSKSHWLEHPP